MKQDDLYAVLGVSRSATLSDIKRAYRREAKRCHPDKTPGTDEPFKCLSTAYETLSDPRKRAMYDRATRVDSRPRGNMFDMSGLFGAGSSTVFPVGAHVVLDNSEHLRKQAGVVVAISMLGVRYTIRYIDGTVVEAPHTSVTRVLAGASIRGLTEKSVYNGSIVFLRAYTRYTDRYTVVTPSKTTLNVRSGNICLPTGTTVRLLNLSHIMYNGRIGVTQQKQSDTGRYQVLVDGTCISVQSRHVVPTIFI